MSDTAEPVVPGPEVEKPAKASAKPHAKKTARQREADALAAAEAASDETFAVPHVAPEASDTTPLREDRFLDRELSWLAFNERVLELAEDESTPLLERARFLAIFASNLDEFFMVRVAGLKRRIATGIATRSASGLEPREVLEEISTGAHELMSLHAELFAQTVRPALADEGISFVPWD